MNTSEYMIQVADAMRKGAAENIVRLAMHADGYPSYRIETIIRWCKLYNERTADEYREENFSLSQTER